MEILEIIPEGLVRSSPRSESKATRAVFSAFPAGYRARSNGGAPTDSRPGRLFEWESGDHVRWHSMDSQRSLLMLTICYWNRFNGTGSCWNQLWFYPGPKNDCNDPQWLLGIHELPDGSHTASMGTRTPPMSLLSKGSESVWKIGRPWTPQSVHDFIQASFFPIGIPNLQNSAKTSTKAIIYIASDH